MIPGGYAVDLFAGDVITKVYIGSYEDDGSSPCINLGSEKNEVESAIVRPIKQGHATGLWEKVPLSEAGNFRYPIGVTNQEGGEAEDWAGYMLEASMDLGIDFIESASSKRYTIGTEYQTRLRKNIQENEIKGFASVICGEGLNSSVWQWVIKTQDGSIVYKSHKAICYRGEGHATPPSCPPSACNDPLICKECSYDWQYM